MPHYVYIIYSESADVFYKGETVDHVQRVNAHNADLSNYTRLKGPWKLVYLEEFLSRKEALLREKAIKRLKSPVVGENNQRRLEPSRYLHTNHYAHLRSRITRLYIMNYPVAGFVVFS